MNQAGRPAPRNRTIVLTEEEKAVFQQGFVRLCAPAGREDVENALVHQNLFDVVSWLPRASVDLLILDPPYNLTKLFHEQSFCERSPEEYMAWVESWLPALLPTLKPTASVYICSDWRSSSALHLCADRYLKVRNRITWEREKGRGAKRNWKNCLEDIWFCTVSDTYTFNVDDVKLKRKVIAPYRDADGAPKDWEETRDGAFRMTHPSNLWTDITVPFWSMPENTDHPTQKPEKLLAKLILASSNPGDLILDPFAGSGSSLVVAKKLGRSYLGIEQEEHYCCLAAKRLKMAEQDTTIQGYHEGVFWERNTNALQDRPADRKQTSASNLFEL